MATIIIEAPLKSGAMNTANHTINLNKPLYSVPWNLNYFRGKGCNELLKNGAIPLIDFTQILSKFDKTYIQEKIEDFETDTPKPHIPENLIPLYEFIKEEAPVSLESIINFFYDTPVSNINSNLSILEINGSIKLNDDLYFIQ